MVHRRDVDGEVLVFGNQGDLYLRAMTWWDHGTGSVWSQPLGEAILGPLTGTRLELVPSTLTDWGGWRRAHPGTLALDADGGPTGFRMEAMVVVTEVGERPVAWRWAEVHAVGVVNDRAGAVPVAVTAPPDEPQGWAVLLRDLGDRVIRVELVDGVLAEIGGPGRWDPIRGTVVAGDVEPLVALPAFTSFERDFAVHQPDGVVRGVARGRP